MRSGRISVAVNFRERDSGPPKTSGTYFAILYKQGVLALGYPIETPIRWHSSVKEICM